MDACMYLQVLIFGLDENEWQVCHRWWYRGCNAMVLCLVIVGGTGDVKQWYCVLSSLVVQGM